MAESPITVIKEEFQSFKAALDDLERRYLEDAADNPEYEGIESQDVYVWIIEHFM